MKRNSCILWVAAVFCFLLLSGCSQKASEAYIDVTQYGVLPSNSGKENSENLQMLLDRLPASGGTLYIPGGVYAFSENGSQTIGSHCIKMRSNVSIVGDGANTVLKPTGESEFGLDMFYFNAYLDDDLPVYLENCTFRGFVIDASDTSCRTYTSAGKGFMLNLVRNCHWENVIVQNTDATGFGMDCPIDCSISLCVAINCGKAATLDNSGASGFGIGYGYSDEESMDISLCEARDNKKFGFFFEHQGRFDQDKYSAKPANTFTVRSCTALDNAYNFGGIQAENVIYEKCSSGNALKYGYFFENVHNSKLLNCISTGEAEASFVIVQTESLLWNLKINNISVISCSSKNTKTGAMVLNHNQNKLMKQFVIRDCSFEKTETAVVLCGRMDNITVTGNRSDKNTVYYDSMVEGLISSGNSWD